MVQEFTSIFHDTVLESNGTTIMDKFNNKFIKGNGVKNSVNLSGVILGKEDKINHNNKPQNNINKPSSKDEDD